MVRGRTALFIAILAASFNLRVGIAAVGPLIEDIRDDTGMTSALAGALITIPFICMAIFSFLGAPLVRRVGEGPVVLGSLLAIAAGSAARALAPSSLGILVATVPIGLGIAFIGITLPAAVKRWFPDRGGEVTGAYVASLSVGIMLVGLGLVPLSGALGGWRPSLASTALPALVAALLWVVAGGLRRGVDDGSDNEVGGFEGREMGFSLRAPLTLAIVFGLQSMCFAGLISWAPAVYQEAGWTAGQAGFVTTSIGAFTVLAALTFPRWTDRRDRRPWIAGTGFVMSVGVLGIALVPVAWPWFWLTLFGIGSGAIFALLLAMPLDLSVQPSRVATLSAWMLGIGYLFSAASPVLVGGLRDLSDGFLVPILTLSAIGLLSALLAFSIPRARLPARSTPVAEGASTQP